MLHYAPEGDIETYPDGEVVAYHYNAAGQIVSLSGNKQGRESVIVDRIGYDKDGHTVLYQAGQRHGDNLHLRQAAWTSAGDEAYGGR